MISEMVVGLSLLMVAGFGLVYLAVPGWRYRIERPKHNFQDQLRQFDSSLGHANGERGEKHEQSSQ